MSLELISNSMCFNGFQKVYKHRSETLSCDMKFSLFLPSCASDTNPVPIIVFLSGLTCTEQNFIIKSGFQKYAEKYKVAVLGPDTSPRGPEVHDDTTDWSLGQGAGFYVDATNGPWEKSYRMYSYVTKELIELVKTNFKSVQANNLAITGHSMGGHGALILFLKNPSNYKSVSAFAPISNPMASAWGRKCFTHYLGSDHEVWKSYDATELIKIKPQKETTILIDQGSKDEWLHELVPDNFVEACKKHGQPVEYNLREGYDHGYYFVGTFIENHIEHHARFLYSDKK